MSSSCSTPAEVVEAGTHDQLMAVNGRYAELFRLQASAYFSDDDA